MSSAEEFDLGGEGEATASPKLAQLHRYLSEAEELKETLERIGSDLERAQKAYDDLTVNRIPDLMMELLPGLEKLEWNGLTVKLVDQLVGSMPNEPDKNAKAARYLDEHEGGAMIKTKVETEFSRKEHNLAVHLAEKLKAEGYLAYLLSDVHHGTLKSWVRERLRNGEEVDLPILGLHGLKRADIRWKPGTK
jgi:hypothetical protein